MRQFIFKHKYISIILMFFVMLFSLLGTIGSPYISSISLTSVYSQEIARSKYDWSLNFVEIEDARSITDARSKLRGFETNLNFVTRGDFASFLVCGDEKTKFRIYNSDMQEIESVVNINLDEVCRYNDSFGFLYGFPAEPMFNDNRCDWNLFPTADKKSSSYITSSIADQLISLQPDKYKNGYEDLIGEVYYLRNNDDFRQYTINNVINTSKKYGDVFKDFFGDFIVSADKELFNEYECSISISFMSDFTALNDFVTTLENEDVVRSSMMIKRGDNWLETNASKNISKMLLQIKKASFSVLQIISLTLSLLFLALFIITNQLLLKDRQVFILRIELICSLSLFAIVGLMNIIGKANYYLNIIFNFIFCITISVIFIYLVVVNVILLLNNKKGFSK